MKKDKLTDHSKADKIKRRQDNLRCSICPPNRGENAKRRPKHGKTKPKYKTEKRKGLIDHSCPPNCPGCDAE